MSILILLITIGKLFLWASKIRFVEQNAERKMVSYYELVWYDFLLTSVHVRLLFIYYRQQIQQVIVWRYNLLNFRCFWKVPSLYPGEPKQQRRQYYDLNLGCRC